MLESLMVVKGGNLRWLLSMDRNFINLANKMGYKVPILV